MIALANPSRHSGRVAALVLALVLAALPALACQAVQGSGDGSDPYTHPGSAHFIADFPARASGGLVNVVVEIPAGTDAKWEVTKPDGVLRWQFKNGAPRVVKYLGYPGNYGMVPRTLLPKEAGGDGDPLDVLVLGPALERGTVQAVRVIGVLELLDGGEQDDKLVAVLPGTALGEVESLDELDREFPGVTAIVETWFKGYKGRDEGGRPRMVSRGFQGAARAEAILDAAVSAYR